VKLRRNNNTNVLTKEEKRKAHQPERHAKKERGGKNKL